ncbi:MAG: protease modulator HflC [Alphaproteobacteria bacterium]|nr:protease modulator HflC [Alphaproteobacteria bacterium]
MNRTLLAAVIALVVIAVVGFSSLFQVDQRQQALVVQFGNPIRAVPEAGLHFKLPFIQDVLYFERRVLDLDPPKQQVILADQKRLDVDAYARYRIVNPLLFYQSVVNENGARARLNQIILGAARGVLGNVSLERVLSDKRADIVQAIKVEVNTAVRALGIEIVDVRLRRADYPAETSQAIFNRMKSEREREAKEFRAEGGEIAAQIRADADRQKVVIVADAQRRGQVLRGEGDATAVKLYADAFGQDPDFFAFYRTMEAYRVALGNGDATMVLSPDSDFFRYFGDMTGARGRNPK